MFVDYVIQDVLRFKMLLNTVASELSHCGYWFHQLRDKFTKIFTVWRSSPFFLRMREGLIDSTWCMVFRHNAWQLKESL